jgi:hypothetical protein
MPLFSILNRSVFTVNHLVFYSKPLGFMINHLVCMILLFSVLYIPNFLILFDRKPVIRSNRSGQVFVKSIQLKRTCFVIHGQDLLLPIYIKI